MHLHVRRYKISSRCNSPNDNFGRAQYCYLMRQHKPERRRCAVLASIKLTCDTTNDEAAQYYQNVVAIQQMEFLNAINSHDSPYIFSEHKIKITFFLYNNN